MKIGNIVGIIIIIMTGFVSAAPTGWRNETCVYFPTEYDLSHLCLSVGDPSTIHILAQANGADRCVDVVYYRSTNTGVSWFGGVNFEFGVSPVPYRSTDIISQGNEVLVCYQHSMDNPNYINFFRSTNSGNTWTPCIHIQTSAQHPRLAMEGNYVHAFYSYKPDASGYEVYLKQSTDHGATWPTDQCLTVADRNSWHPAVSVNANAIHLVWADNRDNTDDYEIFYNRSTDQGVNWMFSTTGYKMVDINGVSEYPDIVAYTDPNYQAVHVVWMDNRQDAPGVYYLRSTNNGVNWPSTPSLLLDGGRHPAITADSRGLYIVCVKNSDIWYLESTNWGTVMFLRKSYI